MGEWKREVTEGARDDLGSCPWTEERRPWHILGSRNVWLDVGVIKSINGKQALEK